MMVAHGKSPLRPDGQPAGKTAFPQVDRLYRISGWAIPTLRGTLPGRVGA